MTRTAVLAAEAEISRRKANDGNVVLEGIPEVPEELVAQLAQYQNVRTAKFEDWKADGSGVYLSTRFGDVAQIHRADMPGGARRQLTFFAEPVSSVVRRPDSDELAFAMDEGGTEDYQLYLFDPSLGKHRRLTDGTSRNTGLRFSRDGRRIAYISTRRNGRANDIWTMEVDRPESARIVRESPPGSWWGISDWSADDQRLLVSQYINVNTSYSYVLNLEDGSLQQIAGPADDAPSVNLPLKFDPSGDGVFLISDQASEFNQLTHLDLLSGERRILSEAIPWNVTGLTLSRDRRRGAFLVNADGLGELYLLDTQDFRFKRIESLPIGLVSGGVFSPDGDRLGLTLESAKTPADVFTLELGEDALDYGDLVRWTWSEVGGLDTETFREPKLIHYPTFDQVDGERRNIPAFVYKPKGDGPHPVIVSIHGGPESQARPGFSSVYQLWIERLGAAVAVPNVRGSSGYGKTYLKLDNGVLREDSVRDISALLDWIAEQPDLDEKRVALYGGSYGGYMVLAGLVHESARLCAGVDVVGISNFVTFLENTEDYRRDQRRQEYGDERDPEMRKHLISISPNQHADKITAPLFVAQGQNDPRVPVSEAAQIVAEVRSAGYDVWYFNALNEGHGFAKKENRDLFIQLMILFLEKHLLGKEAI